MSLLEEINKTNNHVVALIEIFDKNTLSWVVLKDVVSFDVAISRDDNRTLIYSVMPPMSTASIKLNNFNSNYSMDENDSNIDIVHIVPDSKIRIFLGYKTNKANKKYVTASGNFINNIDNYHNDFDESCYYNNIKFNSAGFLFFAYGGISKHIIPTSLSKCFDDIDYCGVYISKVIHVSLNDTLTDLSFVKTIEIDIEASDNLFFAYRLCLEDENIDANDFSDIIPLSKTIDINKKAKSIQYAILARNETSSPLKSIAINVSQNFDTHPVFFGAIESPRVVISNKEHTISITAQTIFKSILDESLGSLSFEGENKIEDIILLVLKKSEFYSDDILGMFETTNIIIKPKAPIIISEGKTIRDYFNMILEIAYDIDESSGEAVFYRLFDDMYGRIHFMRSNPNENTKYTISSINNIREMTIFTDTNKLINSQSVFGRTETEHYPEQDVALVVLEVSAEEPEKKFIIDLITQNPDRRPVAHINYKYINQSFVSIAEDETQLEGGVSRVSFNEIKKCGELAIVARNKTFQWLPVIDVNTSLIVRATPLSLTETYIGEHRSQASIERYGKKEGKKIENEFITSSIMAQKVARAIVECRSKPITRVECSLVMGGIIPTLKLNDACKIIAPSINKSKTFIVTEIRYNFSRQTRQMNIIFESIHRGETNTEYDNTINYDILRLYDEDGNNYKSEKINFIIL